MSLSKFNLFLFIFLNASCSFFIVDKIKERIQKIFSFSWLTRQEFLKIGLAINDVHSCGSRA